MNSPRIMTSNAGRESLPSLDERISPDRSPLSNLRAFLGVNDAAAILERTICAEYWSGDEGKIGQNSHPHQMVITALYLLTEAVACRGGMHNEHNLNTTLQGAVAQLSNIPNWSYQTIIESTYRQSFTQIKLKVLNFAYDRVSDMTVDGDPEEWLDKSLNNLAELCKDIIESLKPFEVESQQDIGCLLRKSGVDIEEALETSRRNYGRSA